GADHEGAGAGAAGEAGGLGVEGENVSARNVVLADAVQWQRVLTSRPWRPLLVVAQAGRDFFAGKRAVDAAGSRSRGCCAELQGAAEVVEGGLVGVFWRGCPHPPLRGYFPRGAGEDARRGDGGKSW